MNSLKPYLGRLIFTILGLIAAILFMTLGFLKTLLILVCGAVGYIIGTHRDKGIDFKKWLLLLRNIWR